MTLQLARQQRHETRPPRDRRPRRHPKRPSGRQGRSFQHAVQMPPRVLVTVKDHEQPLLDALEALRLEGRIAGFGWEDVCFHIIRTGKHNGRHGLKIPDASVVTNHGIIFLELSQKFSKAELDALEFLRTRYRIEVIAIDHPLLEAIENDRARLLDLILEAEGRLRLAGPGPFEPAIMAARSATAAKREEIKANAGEETIEPVRRRSSAAHQLPTSRPASVVIAIPAAIPPGLAAARRQFDLGLRTA